MTLCLFFFFNFCLLAVLICPWLLPPSPFLRSPEPRQSSVMPKHAGMEWPFSDSVLWRLGHLGSSLLEIWMLVSKAASLNIFSLIPSLLSQPLCFLQPLFRLPRSQRGPGEAGLVYKWQLDILSLIRWDSENQGVI